MVLIDLITDIIVWFLVSLGILLITKSLNVHSQAAWYTTSCIVASSELARSAVTVCDSVWQLAPGHLEHKAAATGRCRLFQQERVLDEETSTGTLVTGTV